MTARENTELIAPAYILDVSYPVEPNRNKSYTFRNDQLLEARQAVIHRAKQVLTEKGPHEVLDITISLVEIDRLSVPNRHKPVATVLSQRFNRTMFIQDEKDLLADMQMDDFTKRSLPPSLFKSVGLEQTEAGNSQEIVVQSLAEVAEESAYYRQYGHLTGLPQHQE